MCMWPHGGSVDAWQALELGVKLDIGKLPRGSYSECFLQTTEAACMKGPARRAGRLAMLSQGGTAQLLYLKTCELRLASDLQ